MALALFAGSDSLADPTPALSEVLRRAGEQAAASEEKLAVTVAQEEYQQGLMLGRDNTPRARRTIVSDVLWLPTGDAMVWAFFRDVAAVDGQPVRDRAARLEQLFAGGATLEARQRATEILNEGARYNLGTRRTVNSPTLALSALHPRNQARFRFRTSGIDDSHGVRAVKVRFSETARPALIHTSKGEDVPASGVLWIEPTEGALIASELRLDVRGFPVEIEVLYRREPRLGAWLPAEMRESYGGRSRSAGEDRLEATARYSGYRRAEVELTGIQPVR